MNAKQTGKLSTRLLKLSQSLQKEGQKDAGLKPIAEQFYKLWLEVQKLSEARDLAEARRKDKGQVLWELHLPRSSWMDRQGRITRTPNLTITDHGFGLFSSEKEPSCYVHHYPRPEDPWNDLARALERANKDFPLEKMRERVAMVLALPRGSGAAEYGELEREEKARLEKLADCWCRCCHGRGWIGDRVTPFAPCSCTTRRKEAA